MATLNDIVLTQGDGVGATIEPSVSLTVQENTEILLVDLGPALSSLGSGEDRKQPGETSVLTPSKRAILPT